MPKVSIYIKSFPLWYIKPYGMEVEIIAMGDRKQQVNIPFFNLKEGTMNILKLKQHSEGLHRSVADIDLELKDVDTVPITKLRNQSTR